MLLGKIHDLRHLGFSHFVCVYAAYSDALLMDVEHDASRIVLSFVEETLKNQHDEFHRCEIVVQQ